MDSNDRPKFTCSACGGHEVVVSRVWTIQAGTDSETWKEWGPLKDDHHLQFEYKERIEADADDEVQRGDFGEFQEDDSDSEPEEYEMHEPETNQESDEFFVNCNDCDREIEFGWSEADRRGLVQPIEYSDFDPEKSWPDPKYLDAWEQRGWLREGHRQ